MKFKYGQNQTIIQTIKNKISGTSSRHVVCKFDENGELETEDIKLIFILQHKLPGCTWDEEDSIVVEAEEVKEILSDDDLKEEGLKRFSEMTYKELQVAYSEKTGKSGVSVKKSTLLKELEV